MVNKLLSELLCFHEHEKKKPKKLMKKKIDRMIRSPSHAVVLQHYQPCTLITRIKHTYIAHRIHEYVNIFHLVHKCN